MRKRIVLTRPDGCVSIVTPSMSAIRFMSLGGRWADYPKGFADEQIERQIRAGHNPDAAFRYVKAMTHGGLTTAEALEVIRDRDCAHRGTGIELWDIDDVPSDRWFRKAWRRSHNGGPISLDLAECKNIQWRRISGAISEENKRRADDYRLEPVSINESKIRNRLNLADCSEVVRRIWPEELSR